MKVFKDAFLFSLLVLFSGISAFSQSADTAVLNTILTKTDNFAKKYPKEKVYLHFDKPYYAVDDTIWFKAYLTAGIHTPSPLSKILYVDIISSQDTIIQTLKLPVNNSSAWGSIALAAPLYKQGNYHIKAYTRWMMNFDPDYFFSKTIAVGNGDNKVNTHITFSENTANANARIVYKNPAGTPLANKKITWTINEDDKQTKGKGNTDINGVFVLNIPDKSLGTALLTTVIETDEKPVSNTFPLKSANNKIDLQFFPEGGDLVSELPSKVAFKAVKTDGKGIDIKGNIVDNEGNIVSNLASQHLGMGVFVLVPAAGKSYTANITSPANYTGSYKLPEVNLSGITLTVNATASPEKLNVKFLSNTDFFAANQGKMLYLVAKSGEVICYAAKIGLNQQAINVAIPKDKFPTGIVQITLFSGEGQPLSERIAFVENQDDLNITLKTDKATYGKRQKVKLSIAAADNKLPVEANLSVSVIDETKVPYDENAEITILSNLLLTSDLKGYIEKPNYYFNRPTDKTAADLDILMLTQGYRRFLYANILSDKFPPLYFAPEQGINITGILRNSTGMPLNKANVKLRIPDKYFTAYAVTNGSGEFKFENVVVSDSSQTIVSSADYSNKNPMLTVDPIAIQPAFTTKNLPGGELNIDSSMNKYLQNNKLELRNSRVLKEVVITGKSVSHVPSHLDYGTLSGLSAWPDHLISKDRLNNCPSFFICMQSMLMGVTYDNQNFYITRDYNTGNRTPMQIFFNGMPVDVNYLNSINSNDIESVEVFLKDELGLVNRTYQSNGVLVINGKKVEKQSKMKMDEIRNLLPKPGEVKFIPQGYTIAREFYAPKYSTTSGAIQGSDLRTTIHWDPKVKTDKTTGNTLIEFFNADGKGTYKIIVEGIDADGHIGRSIYRYKVE